ncbi:hypothetical protein SAMN05519104_4350 [Rhizobiales bacterium GAS188]|nr:hypothetical protein SAMN05519104_4350 [Rhizobiales bacterium GAS188]
MGGFGSGRRSTMRETVENCRAIDVSQIFRTGRPALGWSGRYRWTGDGEGPWIDLRAESDRLHLSYRIRIDGNDWADVAETVRIVRVPCRFGGARPYFECPGVVNGVSCRRRVAKLFQAGCYFACRKCYGLSYASQSESAWDRALRRAAKFRRRLAGNPGIATPFPPRPRGMRRSTFERLRRQAIEAEVRARELLATETASLRARYAGASRNLDSRFFRHRKTRCSTQGGACSGSGAEGP